MTIDLRLAKVIIFHQAVSITKLSAAGAKRGVRSVLGISVPVPTIPKPSAGARSQPADLLVFKKTPVTVYARSVKIGSEHGERLSGGFN